MLRFRGPSPSAQDDESYNRHPEPKAKDLEIPNLFAFVMAGNAI
jgi:hypothetical protein